MAQLELTELLIDAVLYKLKQGMPARVAALNSRRADDVTLDPPGDGDYFRYTRVLIPSMGPPSVIVTEGPDGADVHEEGPHSLALSQQLSVVLVADDPAPDRLGRLLLRLRVAVIETLWDDTPKERLAHPHGGLDAAYALHLEGWRPGRVFQVPEEGGTSFYRSNDIILFRLDRVEE